MLKKRLLQTYITLTIFLLGWQLLRYLATNVPEFSSTITVTILLVIIVLVGAVAAQAITNMIDDYDKRKAAEEAPAAPTHKPGKKK